MGKRDVPAIGNMEGSLDEDSLADGAEDRCKFRCAASAQAGSMVL
jgi:hypothetical protein